MKIVRNGVTYDTTTKELAAYLGFSEAHIREKAGNGKIPHMRRGREYRFNKELAESAFIEDHTNTVETESEQAEYEPNYGNEDIDDIIIGV